MAMDLTAFQLEQVLNIDELSKTITFAGKFTWDSLNKVAIIKISPENPQFEAFVGLNRTELVFSNSIFRKYTAEIPLNAVIEVIFPATRAVYYKHLPANTYLIEENWEIYSQIISPYIESVFWKSTEWVRNVLEGREEREKVWVREEQFVVVMDYKVQRVQENRFYFLGITDTSLGLKSLRDLRAAHLPLLRRLHSAALSSLSSALHISPHSILSYIHYPPSFYHFHIHFVPVDAYFSSNTVPRAHMLSEVIANIERNPLFYQETTLPVTVKDSEPVYERIRTVINTLPEAKNKAEGTILERLD